MKNLFQSNGNLFLVCLVLVSCTHSINEQPFTDSLYYGGEILTMEGESPQYEEAVLVRNGIITFVGTKEAAEELLDSNAKLVDLRGKTMLPGFIDSHSHLNSAINIINQANLSSPPVGGCTSISDLIAELQNCKSKNGISNGDWVFGWGYDESQLEEKRHPNRVDLDKHFPDNPVFIQHVSGHMGVANTKALELANIDETTPNPEGGLIVRTANSNKPTGLLQETAIRFYVQKISEVFESQKPSLFQKALDLYKSNGITTVQEGFTNASGVIFLKQMANENKLDIDVISLPGFTNLEKNLQDSSMDWKHYNNHLKFEGTKIITDGSPQGKTAFFTQPYLTEVPGCNQDCRGFPNLTQEQLNKLFEVSYQNHLQLFVHCNGDAAIDMLLQAHEVACGVTKQSLNEDRRTTIIHSNFVRMDQLEKFKAYKLIPSFFTNHAFFWGDVHEKNLGTTRAFFLSPIHSADSLDIIYTNHTDYNITPLSQLFTVWTAVNRVSRSGIVIGEKEKATVYQALKAITINSAYQYFEEESKGSIKTGKQADFVILDQNPLKVDKIKIKDVRVLQTIKADKIVFNESK